MTNTLRKLMQSKLKTLCENVYFENADSKALFPHIVFAFPSTNLVDINRIDYFINIDLWDKSVDAKQIEIVSDLVINVFNGLNEPFEDILTTFFLSDKMAIADEDKNIQHRVIKGLCQVYKK